MRKALILSSGGIDSTTCVAIAVDNYGADNVSTVSIYYGQKHDKELHCAKLVAEHYKVKHYELDLSNILKYSNCSLLASSTDNVPHGNYADQVRQSNQGIVSTYVPFRNGLMLSAVTTLALSIYPNEEVDIFLGIHADDAAGRVYADCSEYFATYMNKAISIGTYQKVNLVTPLINMNKEAVVKLGLKLKAPYNVTWSCYEGNDKPCGLCGTCRDRKEAFRKNGVADPAPEIITTPWRKVSNINHHWCEEH